MEANLIKENWNTRTLTSSSMMDLHAPTVFPPAATITGPENTSPPRDPTVPPQDILWIGVKPHWLKPVIERLCGFLYLEPGWDSYGALTIEKSTIMRAVRVLSILMKDNTPIPQIVPTSKGGVNFEWESENISLEVEIIPDNSISYYLCKKDEESENTIIDDDVNILVDIVDDLT